MKKCLLTAITALTLTSAFAQTPFLTKTCYRGAFAPAPTPMWTNGWTEWDPQNKNYPATNKTVNSDITTNTTWLSTDVVLLSGPIYVKQNSILTIQPGCIIKGQSNLGSGLFITTGSKLMAVGNANNPIVFTSDQPIGNRAPGDWGGVILMGLGPNNNPNGVNNIEGITPNPLTLYGGGTSPVANDNSGDLEYLRIEFGGYIYAANKEINGLTFGAVGNGTKIDNIQCSFVNDDAFEWFGGTVNCKHLVAYRCIDDNFDTDNGFAGTVQFALGVRDPNFADPTYAISGGSTSEAFESDNDPTGSTATPITSAIFSNITDIGPLRGVQTATCHPGFRRGARIRRNSALKIVNSILIDHKTRGMFIDGMLSETNAAGATLLFKNNIVAGYGERATEQGTFGVINTNTFIAANANDTLKLSVNGSGQSLFLVNPYNFTSPDYRPLPGSLANSGASFASPAIAAATTVSATTVLATIPATICIGYGTTVQSPANFVASSTVSPEYCSLLWTVSPGVTISSATVTNPSFTISTFGTFTTSLVVMNADGTSTVVNSVITTTCDNVGVKETNSRIGYVSVFPNPTSSEMTNLKINANSASSLDIVISDITGKIVALPVQSQSIVAGENNISLNTSELNNGIYFVTLRTASGKETVKLIVNR